MEPKTILKKKTKVLKSFNTTYLYLFILTYTILYVRKCFFLFFKSELVTLALGKVTYWSLYVMKKEYQFGLKIISFMIVFFCVFRDFTLKAVVEFRNYGKDLNCLKWDELVDNQVGSSFKTRKFFPAARKSGETTLVPDQGLLNFNTEFECKNSF